MPAKKPAGVSVAEYISAQIDMSDKSRQEIAVALGYDKANIISMFKQGITKVPLVKVVPLARILGVDPAHLVRIVMREYHQDTWAAIEEAMGGGLATKNEQKMLDVIREATNSTDPPMDPPKTAELRRWAKSLL